MPPIKDRQPEEPEERVRKGLPAAFRIWKTPTDIHCNIWWGREQEAGKRLLSFSRLFPYPVPIPKGGGVFEEILHLLGKISVEIYVVGPERGGSNEYEYEDYAEALGQIKEKTTSAVIVGGSYEGREPEYATIFVTLISFLKK